MVKICHAMGATVEGELGHVGDNEGSAEGSDHLADPSAFFTDVSLAKDFVERTGVDALAIAVGTAHGAYKLPPKLDFNRIREIAATIPTPLVLHGGSGLTDDDFRKCVEAGISKVNIFTDINVSAVEAALRHFTELGKGIIDLLPSIREAVKLSVMEKMRLFGAAGVYGPGTKTMTQEEAVRKVVEEVLRAKGII